MILSEETKPLKIFIGWDSREDIAYQVAKFSIEQLSSMPVEIIPLKQKALRRQGIYTRPDDRMASTEFTFTRFLIPELTGFDGWALFIDCDFVALANVADLFAQADDRYAIMCAQHDYTPKETVKMDGQVQHIYPRKNWSSMMLINCGHPSNANLTKDLVNNIHKTGAYFHRFSWLDDSEIGELSHEWNWLVGWYKEPEDGSPKFLHYTEGGPWFENYRDCEYNHEWYKVNDQLQKKRIHDLESSIKSKAEKITYIGNTDLSKETKDTLNNYLKWTIDPDGDYYKEEHKMAMNKFNTTGEKIPKVAAIDSVGGINYHTKDLAYDEYLEAFILGCGGKLSNWDKESETDNPLVIRGLGGGSRKAILHCWETGREYFAIDTGYFGNGRSKSKGWHRITKNNLQNLNPVWDRPGDRLKKIGYKWVPFYSGKKILICPPSDKVMKLWNQPDPEEWVKQVIDELKNYTDRPIQVRLKPNRTDRISTDTIEEALADDVHCMITYNSIAATEALMNGKPAIALGPNAASAVCNNKLSQVEELFIPDKDKMYSFMCHLSYCQFNKKEMMNGYAWQVVNEG
jgi:lipopolysaccharide biosynthesis glycosyltransferase